MSPRRVPQAASPKCLDKMSWRQVAPYDIIRPAPPHRRQRRAPERRQPRQNGGARRLVQPPGQRGRDAGPGRRGAGIRVGQRLPRGQKMRLGPRHAGDGERGRRRGPEIGDRVEARIKAPGVAALGPEVLAEDVAGDGEEKGAKAGVAAEARAGLDHPEKGLLDEAVPLAKFKPVIAVQKGNPKNIRTWPFAKWKSPYSIWNPMNRTCPNFPKSGLVTLAPSNS